MWNPKDKSFINMKTNTKNYWTSRVSSSFVEISSLGSSLFPFQSLVVSQRLIQMSFLLFLRFQSLLLSSTLLFSWLIFSSKGFIVTLEIPRNPQEKTKEINEKLCQASHDSKLTEGITIGQQTSLGMGF